MREITKEWALKAEEDIESAGMLLEARMLNTSCYHSQQAAEKYLKALLAELGRHTPRIHDVERLFRLIRRAGVDLTEPILEDCIALTGIDTLVRYPGYDADLEEATDALASSRRIRQAVIDAIRAR